MIPTNGITTQKEILSFSSSVKSSFQQDKLSGDQSSSKNDKIIMNNDIDEEFYKSSRLNFE